MKHLAIISACTFAIWTTTAAAQTGSGGSIRVQPGHFCAVNKCVRFSRDLGSVSIQGRRPVSVAAYNLRSNSVISVDQFREIFFLALRQSGVNGNRG